MILLKCLLPLLILLSLTSCQVKQASSDADFISGHVETTNKFTLINPAAKAYVASETIHLALSFPFIILMDSTGGTPRLKLTIGSTVRYATYVAQGNTKELHFEYVVANGENDNNGITIDALELNSSVLNFDHNAETTNCDVSTLSARNLTGLTVDTSAPAISSFLLNNIPGLYNKNDVLHFLVTYNEPVFVLGSPKFTMKFSSGGVVEVNYVSGSGSSVLAFSYTIMGAVADSNGFDEINSPLDLGTGSLKDAAGNDANLDFSSFVPAALLYSQSVIVNGQYPYVLEVVAPANRTYAAAQNLDITFEFDRPVNVTGNPYMNIVIGANTRQAHYFSGTGTEFITFRYTTLPGDIDLDGITLATSITSNSGNIVDSANPAVSFFPFINNRFTLPNTSGVIVNAIQPAAISVSRNIDNTLPAWGGSLDNVWIIGQELNLTVSFNTAMYVTQPGTPSISLVIGGVTRQAIYLSGGNGQTSLIFSYVIQEGDLDTDGTIQLGNLNLNGGVIVDAANTNVLLTMPVSGIISTSIDGVRPTISNVTAPANGTYSLVAPLRATEMLFAVIWSEAVQYSSTSSGSAFFNLTIGADVVKAEYVSGINSSTLLHRPLNLSGRNSTGITSSSTLAGTATIKDRAGNIANVLTFTPPDTSNIKVDTTLPVVTNVSPVTPDGTHKAGTSLSFDVTFQEPVTTNVAGQFPCITLTIGLTNVCLLPDANKTDTIHRFSYTILANQLDSNGVTIGNIIGHNGVIAYARDAGRNNATAAFTVPNTSGIKVDAVLPTVSLASGSASKVYVSGDVLKIDVTYSEAITVDLTDGTPSIAVDFYEGTDHFLYSGGSGTNMITFSRTLDADHLDMDGLPSSISSILLNSGKMQDAGNNNAPTNFPTVDLSNVFAMYSKVRLWTTSDFVNKAPSSPPAITNAGALETVACGNGTEICRSFDGNDSLSLAESLTNVKTIFVVYKLPAILGINHDMFGSGLSIDANGATYDLISAAATITYNSTVMLTNVTAHDTNSDLGSTQVVQVDFQTGQDYASEFLIDTDFDGAIGEVIAVEGNLTTTEKDNIRNYLINKFN